MPIQSSRGKSSPAWFVMPVGAAGLDLNTQSDLVSPDRLRVAEYVRHADRSIRRAAGSRRVSVQNDVNVANGSWTFASTANYAQIGAATQLLIPAGGFAFKVSVTCVRPSAGNDGHILATRATGKAYGPLSLTLDENGFLTAAWRKESDESEVTVTASSAVAAGGTAHVLAVYDPYTSGGTFTLFVNGESMGTATSVGETETPLTTETPNWYFGVEYNPSGAAVTANTEFDGKIDAFTLFTLRGIDPSATSLGGKSWIDTAREFSFQDWPNPQSRLVLAHYGFDETSGTALTDASRFKNHGLLVGSPTSTAQVAHSTVMGQLATTIQQPNGKRSNVVIAGGQLSHELVRTGTA